MTAAANMAGASRSPAGIGPPGWARILVALTGLANLLVLGFVSLPVIGFFLMSFNGWGTPTTVAAKLVFALVMIVAAALPVASIFYAVRFLKRGRVALAILAGALVPVLGGTLFAVYGPGSAPPAAQSGTANQGSAP